MISNKTARSGFLATMTASMLLSGGSARNQYNQEPYHAIKVRGMSGEEMGTAGTKKKTRSRRRHARR